MTASLGPGLARAAESSALMLEFAKRTGLDSGGGERRYLWTDAFAVCNFLALERITGEVRYRELALRLIERVHRVLGRHRGDDARTGWLSGLADRDAEQHPTRGGLRIGKRLPERSPEAPFDERLEWEQDGQYFHYLTRWMHALDQTSRSTGDTRFNTWARELGETAHRAFTTGPPGARWMVWKMSIDLSRPLVASMGQHDPLDGWITCRQLLSTARSLRDAPREPTLAEAVRDFAAMSRSQPLATADPLGIGGLLIDACRVSQLEADAIEPGEGLVAALLDAALAGLSRYARSAELSQPAARRLAFRELGLAIGLGAVGRISGAHDARLRARIAALARYAPLGLAIESFWRAPEHRANPTWLEHRDIDDVMLATCLAPDGLVVLSPTATPPYPRAGSAR